jgi:arsenate reductase-like glutaredoxin family protein
MDYAPRDYARKPLTEDDIRAIAGPHSLGEVMNPRSPSFRKLGIERDSIDDAQALELMLGNQNLVRRPTLAAGDVRIFGFDADAYEELAGAEA